MIDPKEASNLTAASQETVRTMARLQSDLDLAKAENVRLRDAARAVISECFVPATGPTHRWHQEYYDAFNELREALGEQS